MNTYAGYVPPGMYGVLLLRPLVVGAPAHEPLFVKHQVNPSKLQDIVTGLQNNPDIQVIYRTTGNWDILVEVILKDMKELNWFLEKQLNIDGVTETEVNVTIETYKKCPCTNL